MAKKPPALGQSLVNLSGQIMSLTFALSSLLSIGDTVKNQDMSWGEKLLSIIMSLSFVISSTLPVIVNISKVIKGWGT